MRQPRHLQAAAQMGHGCKVYSRWCPSQHATSHRPCPAATATSPIATTAIPLTHPDQHSQLEELVPPVKGAGGDAVCAAGRRSGGPQPQPQPVGHRLQVRPQLLRTGRGRRREHRAYTHISREGAEHTGSCEQSGAGSGCPGGGLACAGNHPPIHPLAHSLTAASRGVSAACRRWLGSLNPSSARLPGWM